MIINLVLAVKERQIDEIIFSKQLKLLSILNILCMKTFEDNTVINR